jgi:hypothetical protein
MSTHARYNEFVFFAQLIGDWNSLLDFWLAEKNWLAAIDVLSRQSRPELYYKSAFVLMEHVPEETINLWIRQSNLNPRHLIPALLRYTTSLHSRTVYDRVFSIKLR